MTILVAGMGSAHGADSLGWEVVDVLAQAIESENAVLGHIPTIIRVEDYLHLKKFQHPSAALAEAEHHRTVLFVGAIRSSQHEYGELVQLPADELKPSSLIDFIHTPGLADALALAQKIQQLPADCWVLGLNAQTRESQLFMPPLKHKLVESVWQAVVDRCDVVPFMRQTAIA